MGPGAEPVKRVYSFGTSATRGRRPRRRAERLASAGLAGGHRREVLGGCRPGGRWAGERAEVVGIGSIRASSADTSSPFALGACRRSGLVPAICTANRHLPTDWPADPDPRSVSTDRASGGHLVGSVAVTEPASSIPSAEDRPRLARGRYVPALLTVLVPGLGHLVAGRPRLAALFGLPLVFLAALAVGVLAATTTDQLVGALLDDRVLVLVLAPRGRPARLAAPGARLLAHGPAAPRAAHARHAAGHRSRRPGGRPAGVCRRREPGGARERERRLRRGRRLFGSVAAGSDADSAPRPPPRVPRPAPTPTPSPMPTATPAVGRINVLILGVDAGVGRNTFLTDTMIVASLDPVAGTVSLLSFPRDLVDVPLPGGGVFSGKVNSLLAYARRNPAAFPGSSGDGHDVLMAAFGRDDGPPDRLLRPGEPRRLRLRRQCPWRDRGQRCPRLLRPALRRVRVHEGLLDHGRPTHAEREPGARLRARAQGERRVGSHAPDAPAGDPVGDPRSRGHGRLPRRPRGLPPGDGQDRGDQHPAQPRAVARRVRPNGGPLRGPTARSSPAAS